MESRRKSRVRSLPRATARLHGREVREILLPRRVSFREPSNYYFEGREERRKYIANCIVIYRDIYIWGDNGDAAMEEGSPPPRMGMTGGMKSAGIVGDPGTRMLGRLAITITIEGEGSSDTRRAATTRRSERPNRASRSSTLACPYWAWASPARRTRTTASTIICRTCLPRTSSRSSSYDPTARPPSCPRLSLSIRVSNVPRKNKEEKTIWLFTRRVTRRKRAAIPIDMFRIRRRKKSIESFQTIVSTSISIEIHEIYIFSLDRSPIRWFAGDRSIFVSKISRNRRFVWHYSTVFFFVFPRGLALSLSLKPFLPLLRVDKPSFRFREEDKDMLENLIRSIWSFYDYRLAIGEEGKIETVRYMRSHIR